MESMGNAKTESTNARTRRPSKRQRKEPLPVAMWGFVILVVAIALYVGGAVLALLQGLLGVDRFVSVQLVWFSGAPLLLGISLIAFDALLLAPRRRGGRQVFNDPIANREVTVALTAYNDEKRALLT